MDVPEVDLIVAKGPQPGLGVEAVHCNAPDITLESAKEKLTLSCS